MSADNTLVFLKASDVNVLAIWPDGHPTKIAYMVSVIHSTPSGLPVGEEDMVVTFAGRVVNLWADTPEQLVPLVEKCFPHLRAVGHPISMEDGSVFDVWHFYADATGARAISDNQKDHGWRLPYPDNVHPIN